MIRNAMVFLTATFLCFSCAAATRPKPGFVEGTRVGIVNSLESYLTHRHITIARMNSFVRQIEVDWNIPAYLDAHLAGTLKKDGRFVPVPLKSPPTRSRLTQLSDQIESAATRERVSQELADFIEKVAAANDLDVIITVNSYLGESPWKIGSIPISLQGYGLLTRTTVMGIVGLQQNWVHPYAQIRVTVFQTRPVAVIGDGRSKPAKGNMDRFNWPVDITQIPRTELDKLRPRIQEYAEQAAKNALRDANMVSF